MGHDYALIAVRDHKHTECKFLTNADRGVRNAFTQKRKSELGLTNEWDLD